MHLSQHQPQLMRGKYGIRSYRIVNLGESFKYPFNKQQTCDNKTNYVTMPYYVLRHLLQIQSLSRPFHSVRIPFRFARWHHTKLAINYLCRINCTMHSSFSFTSRPLPGTSNIISISSSLVTSDQYHHRSETQCIVFVFNVNKGGISEWINFLSSPKDNHSRPIYKGDQTLTAVEQEQFEYQFDLIRPQ